MPEKTPVRSLFAYYGSKPFDVGSGIQLLSDSSYEYVFWSCLSSYHDSGRFTIVNDSIFFRSYMEYPNNQSHDQIKPLIGKKFLLKNGRIYFRSDNGHYDLRYFWIHQDLATSPKEVLDSGGNGYAELYNGKGQIISEGEFRNFKLWDGHILIADNALVRKLDIYKNGLKVRDSIRAKSWWTGKKASGTFVLLF